MAVMTSSELVELMSKVCDNTESQTWTKNQITAAFQAIEDFIELPGTRQAIGNVIETAAPSVFDAAQKELLMAVWAITYARRKGLVLR